MRFKPEFIEFIEAFTCAQKKFQKLYLGLLGLRCWVLPLLDDWRVNMACIQRREMGTIADKANQQVYRGWTKNEGKSKRNILQDTKMGNIFFWWKDRYLGLLTVHRFSSKFEEKERKNSNALLLAAIAIDRTQKANPFLQNRIF